MKRWIGIGVIARFVAEITLSRVRLCSQTLGIEAVWYCAGAGHRAWRATLIARRCVMGRSQADLDNHANR